MGKRLKKHFAEDRIQVANKQMEKCFSIISHQESAIQNYNEISLCTFQMSKVENSDNTRNPARMQRNWITHTFPVGMNTVQPLWKAVWYFLKKTKHALTIQTSNCFPVRLFQRNEHLCSHKILYMNAHSSVICNTQKLYTIQLSFNG